MYFIIVRQIHTCRILSYGSWAVLCVTTFSSVRDVRVPQQKIRGVTVKNHTIWIRKIVMESNLTVFCLKKQVTFLAMFSVSYPGFFIWILHFLSPWPPVILHIFSGCLLTAELAFPKGCIRHICFSLTQSLMKAAKYLCFHLTLSI